MPHNECPMAASLRDGKSARGEILVEKPDGSRISVLAHPEPLRDAEGKVVGALNMLVDITSQRQTEETLNAVFNQAAVGWSVVDRNAQFIEANGRLCQMLGRSLAEMRSLTCADVTHPQDWPSHREQIRRIFEGEISEFTIEKRYLRRDGSPVWVNMAVSPLTGPDGVRNRLVAIVEDITVRKEVEEQLQDLARSLEARVVDRTSQLEAFCYSIAHDLRQHIRGVSLNAHWVRDLVKNDDPEVVEHLSRLVGAAKQLDHMVTDLLSYARSTRNELRCDEVDMSSLAGLVADQLRALYPDARFSIEPGLIGYGDEAALSVVLQNLMDNGCKYSVDPEIHFGQRGDAFFVRDNGSGFDMRYIDKVFEPFQRLHRHHDIPGTGIGLSGVQQIVEKHGGKVWAESKPDEGATFWFTLSQEGSSEPGTVA
jgi:PAS domain S-box-containing protein